jgi:hypothetical protein
MPIAFECPTCGRPYRVAESLAGKSVACKTCNAQMRIPESEDESGQVLRHGPRRRPFEPAIGDSDSIEQISDHIEKYIGPIETVWHELVSDLVHIDLHVVGPTEERPHYTLVTSGMSDRPMTVPEECDESPFAELLLALPPGWPLDEKSWAKERHYWPVRWLKILARLPHAYETWLGFGHTVPNGDPPEPFAAGTRLCCWLAAPPRTVADDFATLRIDAEKTIGFHAILPIYREEMAFKLANGAEPLLERFDRHGVTEVLDIKRKNVCK